MDAASIRRVPGGPTIDIRPFQVDLRGVVDLLSRHIYSSPRVYLRELLQNGRDAITARRELGPIDGRISITPVSPRSDEFVVRDDGVGLTADEVSDLLATVGRSSKRDIFDLPRQGYLGQFGIGLLSCFMVADRIVIRSRSARGGRPVEWTGDADGTFTVRELDDDIPIGTSVHLVPRPDMRHLLETPAVLEHATTFGEMLPVAVTVDLPGGGEERITHAPAFLDDDLAVRAAHGRELLGAEPLDVIPLEVPATGVRGTAYVLPYAPSPTAKQGSRVYLGRMLLGERVDGVLPDWAFFVRLVLDADGLRPTASRESLVDDDALELTRAAIGEALRRWVRELGITAPHRLNTFVGVHQLALKGLVLHDDELARIIVRWLPFETTSGTMSVDRLVREHPLLRYTDTVDEFRQVAGIAASNVPVINGGYTHDSEIVRRLPELFDGVTVEKADAVEELERLAPPPLESRAETAALEDRAVTVLAELDCAVIVRGIARADIPSLYVADPELFRTAERRRAAQAGGSGVWGSVMGTLDEAAARDRETRSLPQAASRLCLNWNNRVVRTLATTRDDAVFSRAVQLLYVQALLAGHRPLAPRDRELMTTALSDLIAVSVGFDAPTISDTPDTPPT